MHRNELKERLAAYRRRWPAESETVTRFEAFIDSHPDGFQRSCRGRPHHWLGVDREQGGRTRSAHPPPRTRAVAATRWSQREGTRKEREKRILRGVGCVPRDEADIELERRDVTEAGADAGGDGVRRLSEPVVPREVRAHARGA